MPPRVEPMCVVISGLYNQFMCCLILIVWNGTFHFSFVGVQKVEWWGGDDDLGDSTSVVCIYRVFLADDTLSRRARTYDLSFFLVHIYT